MGCDIHMHVELKMKADGQWHHWSAQHVSRNYDLFAKMADVRNYSGITPISKPKGVPDDITYLTRRSLELEKGHDHSWLSRAEIRELEAWWTETYAPTLFFEPSVMGGYLDGNGYSTLPDDVLDVRLVFWFDN